MAMFLQESVQSTGVKMSIQEAQLALIESVEAVAELTEATLHADFAVHEKTRGLSEQVIVEAEAGLLTRLAQAVKNVLVKVRDAVVGFFRALKDKLVALWKRLTGGDAVIKMPKSGKAAVEGSIAALEGLVKAVQSDEDKAETYTKGVNKAYAELEKKIKGFKQTLTAEKETKSWVEVKANELSKVNAFATRVAAIAGSTQTEINKDIAAAEKAAAAVKEPTAEQTKAAQEELQGLRAHAGGYNKLATGASGVMTVISQAVAARTEARTAPSAI